MGDPDSMCLKGLLLSQQSFFIKAHISRSGKMVHDLTLVKESHSSWPHERAILVTSIGVEVMIRRAE